MLAVVIETSRIGVQPGYHDELMAHRGCVFQHLLRAFHENTVKHVRRWRLQPEGVQYRFEIGRAVVKITREFDFLVAGVCNQFQRRSNVGCHEIADRVQLNSQRCGSGHVRYDCLRRSRASGGHRRGGQ